MAALVEFVVLGTPVSSGGSKHNVEKWKSAIREAVRKRWTRAPVAGKLRSTMIHFHKGEIAPLDNDNLSKVVHDALNKLVYVDDRQVVDTHAIQIPIQSEMRLVRATPILLETLALGEDFLYMRLDELPDAYTLPE